MIEENILTPEFLDNKKAKLKEDIDSIFAAGDESVLNFFSHYVYWNGIFAGCVINLASKFHLFPTILNLRNTTLPPSDISSFFNQKGHTIAGLIFAAAEDEYADENVSTGERVCHKDMAWHFLQALYNYFSEDIKTREIESFAEIINNEVMEGYKVEGKTVSSELFQGLGFHIASEKIASFEFDYLTKKLESEYPELVSFLKSQTLVQGVNAFSWLEVHGTVEEEHFGYALEASDIIINHFENSPINREPFRELKVGFDKFSSLQDCFFNHYSGVKEVVEA